MSDLRATERSNPRTSHIDLASAREIVDLMNAEDRRVAEVVGEQAEAVTRAVVAAETAFRRGGRLFYVGAGTSGRLGVLDASECPPTFGTDPQMVQGIIAGGLPALTQAQEGAEDDLAAAARAIDERRVSAADFVVGIAASGGTPFVQAALARAKELGAETALVACSVSPDDVLAVTDIPIIAIVGPEVVTGSTRLKAGTATKLILNMITTGAMIRLGKTYGNLMVDLRATNAKLVDRAQRIVSDVCGVSVDEARATLELCEYDVKTAIVMRFLGVSKTGATSRLAEAGGVIRRVMAPLHESGVSDEWHTRPDDHAETVSTDSRNGESDGDDASSAGESQG